MNKKSLLIYLLIFSNFTVFCSLYKNWTSIAKSNFKKGKETYKSILNNLKEKENDCVSLISNDKQISDNFPVDLEYIQKSSDPYPCLTQINKIGEKFDIDLDSDSLKDLSYSRILSEAGCWKYVLGEINTLDVERCDFNGDASRSLIALAKTKCHFIRANRKFPTKKQGCILNPGSVPVKELNSYLNSVQPLENDNEEEVKEEWIEYTENPCLVNYRGNECEKLKRRIVSRCTDPSVMSEAAFQMYHSDLNHIGKISPSFFSDNICFYLQSGDWNRRTETNINKLTDSANHMINVYNTFKDQFEILNNKQNEQLSKAENLTVWIDNIKNDMGDVLRIVNIVKEYQRKTLDFINNFRTYCTYLIFAILGLIATSFEFASGSRWKVLTAIAISCMLEIITHKVFNGWLELDINNYVPPDSQEYIFKTIRLLMASYIILEWLYSFIWYKPGWKIMLKEVTELKKVIENPVIYIPNHSVEKVKEIRYTFDEFVEKFADDDSEYVYESGYTTSDYDSDEELGSGSDYLVDEYLESKYGRRHRRSNSFRHMYHY